MPTARCGKPSSRSARRVPTKLYAAVQDTKVHFRLLHAADQHARKAADGRSRNGGAGGTHADQESRRGRPRHFRAAHEGGGSRATAKTVAADQRRAGGRRADEVDERWFDRPYYLGPDGDREGYFALAEVLAKRNEVGIAHWVLRNKRYVGALHASGGYLLLETLRIQRTWWRSNPCGRARIAHPTSASSRLPSN